MREKSPIASGAPFGSSSSADEVIMRRYLLGELSELEQSKFEEKLFTEEGGEDRLAVVEDELIDEYVYSTLSRSARARFTTYYLSSPTRRERVLSAEALRARLGSVPPHPRKPLLFSQAFVPQWRLALSGVIIAAVGSLVATLITRQVTQQQAMKESQRREQAWDEQGTEQRHHVTALTAALQRAESEQALLQAQLDQRKNTLKMAPPLSFLLTPSTMRGGEGRLPLQLPRQTSAVEFQLRLSDARKSAQFRAVLRTLDGNEVWSRTVRHSGATDPHTVTLVLPGNALHVGDYLLVLSATSGNNDWEEVADYTFRIVRQ